MHTAFGVNLLGISRSGTRLAHRLNRVALQVGDVLLLQGRSEVVRAALPQLGLLPLAQRELGVGQRRRLLVPVTTFAAALLLTIFDVVPIHVSLPGAVAALLVSRYLSLQAAYQAVNWPIIILLGAMIPVGEALETTGGALRIASLVADLGESMPPWSMVAVVLVITMLLSDWINNATAVILMAPIGLGVAAAIGASVDPFSDGGRYRRLVGVPVSDRAPVEHDCDGPRRIPVRRLLEDGASAGHYHHRRGDAADSVVSGRWACEGRTGCTRWIA